MGDTIADIHNNINNHLIRAKQVSPLPIGSGGNNTTKRQLNDTNNQLSMMLSQSVANTKYDPPTPQHITKPVYIEHFTTNSMQLSVSIIGLLLIAYSIISK
jgi:hypothetical protein